jgi:outer membrane protein
VRSGWLGWAALASIAAAALPNVAHAAGNCSAVRCEIKLTPQQLEAAIERLIQSRHYAQATPLIAALKQAPAYLMQSRFLAGYVAEQQGRYGEAAHYYEAILADDPRQTGVRLELAKTMLAQHKPQAAERQFAIAAQDDQLSPEVQRTIRKARDTIRAQRPWQLDVSVGIAPDTNINAATAADTVTVMFGDTPIPLELDDRARRKSGIGETAQLSSRVRLPLTRTMAALIDVDANGTNYAGSTFDDYAGQIAAGLAYGVSARSSVSLEGLAAKRWYGGRAVSEQLGWKAGAQHVVDNKRQVGVQIDVRRTTALFNRGYSGWQAGIYTTYEQALAPALVASIGPFVRRDWLNERVYSDTEIGANAGIGGELLTGLNFGLSGGASRAVYDAPFTLFDSRPRRDWRFVAKATLGDRKLRLLGLSPQISVQWTRVDSSLTLYKMARSRIEFSLARYF